MRILHSGGYNVADNLIAACAAAGFYLEPGDRILDLGCGAGGLVYRLRDLGFEAFGFDIFDGVSYRDASDSRFFGFLKHRTDESYDTRIDPASFRLPFNDSGFDVIFSTSVIEHVIDLNSMIKESARVLKPEGFCYHLYPNKDVLIEPHLYVPFASRIQNRWWFRLWAALGVRNEYQEGMSAAQTAESNVEFCRNGLRYYTRQELFSICANYFSTVRFVDDLYYPNISRRMFWRNRVRALRDPRPFRAWSQQLRMGSLLTTGKIV